MKKVCGGVVAAVIGVVLFGAVGVAQAQQFFGSIFTTKSDGTLVNQNVFDLRSDVYLNGGPQNANSNGLPDGTYYYQVTDPNGADLLSTDPAVCRQVTVLSGVVHGATGPCPHANGSTNPTTGAIPVQLVPFDFTTNGGGEYKVWLIRQTADTSIDPNDDTVLLFKRSDAKTDNFKVKETGSCTTNCELPPGSQITGVKFYDADVDGVFDPNEVGIAGWKIELFGTQVSNTTSVQTDQAGSYAFLGLDPGSYGVCEVLPQNAPVWVPTTPTSINGILVPPDATEQNFGNVCLGAGGGLTLGFWHNKNGQALLTKSDLCTLTGMFLRNANGSDFDPVASASCPNPNNNVFNNGKAALSKWLIGASATNMANMLSAQLATMKLNVLHGFVSGGANIFAGAAPTGCTVPGLSGTGFISINALITAANTDSNHALDSDPNTVAAGQARSCQEFMKNALDNANNNLNFVQSSPCAVNYSGTEDSCAPILILQ